MKSMMIKILSSLGIVGGVNVDFLRKHGAVVGKSVRLYNVKCSPKDATCLEIGDNVTLTGVHIITHDSSLELFTEERATKIGRVVIGSNVFVGIGTIILPNSRIGDNVIIGAGSVVSGTIPDNTVAAGSPARALCDIDSYVSKHVNAMGPDNTFENVKRDAMSSEEIREFNRKIDGHWAYIVKKKA